MKWLYLFFMLTSFALFPGCAKYDLPFLKNAEPTSPPAQEIPSFLASRKDFSALKYRVFLRDFESGRRKSGIAVAAAVLRYWGQSPENVTLMLASNPRRRIYDYSLEEIREILQEHGLKAFVIKANRDILAREINAGRPIIVRLKQNAWWGKIIVAIIGMDNFSGALMLGDPEKGVRMIDYQAFVTAWESLGYEAIVASGRP